MTRPLGAHRTRMRALAREFPRQLIEGYRLGSETPVRWPKGKRGALVAGMGGSAIAADLLDGVLRPEFGWPITTIRGAEIPKWPPDVPIVLVSYSGNTSETLGAYESARATRARLVCVAAGGELARRADRDGHANVRIPPGLPPRGALGWILGVLIGLLDPALPQTLSSRLVASAQRVDGRQREFASRHGGPAQLAHRVADRIPTILAWSGDLPVARRWQTQVEENAKRAARLELLPEALHNALVAWDATPRTEAHRQAAIFVEFSRSPPALARGRRYLERLLDRRGFRVASAAEPVDDPLEAAITGVSFGDHFSLHLAEGAGVDPLETPALARAKRAIGPFSHADRRSPPTSDRTR